MPETLEGWAVLHHIFRVRWAAVNRLPPEERHLVLSEAAAHLEGIARPAEGESAAFSLLGHKGDLLVLHFRRTLDALNEAELGLRRLRLMEYLEEATSYLSFLELGLYEMTVKLDAELRGAGLKPDSKEWKEAWKDRMDKEAQRMRERLYMPIPKDRYLCFYPMNKHRGEHKNWYAVPMEERQRMMRDHGLVGRKYAGRVQQIITGSIGFDDWEWGVYLFARDPLVFKKLVYEMRFDEASVWYGEFGPFYAGIRIHPREIHQLFAGRVPAL
ncbi:MAG: heme-dependent peroxidase [Candidatus Tectomicrobia bacterium]|uniref:Heme-dependent peroxidase n=1 Tax=Tectimicrobiota bacterium TaxID=2528274 RepID=A0A932HZ49_UNCTE|nr:heme-dependent peroxidase [Candidatus Tectomicrobia bacterium]